MANSIKFYVVSPFLGHIANDSLGQSRISRCNLQVGAGRDPSPIVPATPPDSNLLLMPFGFWSLWARAMFCLFNYFL